MTMTFRLGFLLLAGLLALTLFWPSSRLLRIQVIDCEGRPVAGIPVALALDRACAAQQAWGEEPFWQGVTEGAEGLAELRLAAWNPFSFLGARKREDAESHTPGRPTGPGELFLFLPLVGAPGLKIDLSSPPSKTLQFRLPPTGEVRLRVSMEGGAPAADDSLVWLLGRSEALEVRAAFLGHLGLGEVTWPGKGRSKDGEFYFPRVALGLDLIARAVARGRTVVEARGVGPTIPGETIEFSLTIPTRPVLTGRVLEAGGTPARRSGLAWVLLGDGWLTGLTELTGDVDWQGNFRIPLEPRFLEAREGRLLVTDDRGLSLADGRSYATAELSEPLPGGEVFLGDLVLGKELDPGLAEQWILAAGRVRDPDGRPLEGVEILLSEKQPWSRMRRIPSSAAGWMCGRGDPPVLSDAAGEFRIRGWTAAPELRLQAVSGEFGCSPPIRTAPGGTGLELVLFEGGVVEGSVLLDQDVPPAAIDLVLVLGGETEPSVGTISGEADADGNFRFDRVPPGQVSLKILVGKETLVSITGIEVPAGSPGQDPRLRAIDLRGQLRSAELLLTGPSRWDRFLVTLRGRERFSFDAPLPGVPLRLYLGREPAELLIESDWFPPRLIQVLAGDHTLELDPGQVVTLRLDPSSAPLAWHSASRPASPGEPPWKGRSRLGIDTSSSAVRPASRVSTPPASPACGCRAAASTTSNSTSSSKARATAPGARFRSRPCEFRQAVANSS